MCGIVGFSGNFSEVLFFNALKSLNHRGPDDSGFVFFDSNFVGLGHTRLSILDLSSLGHQPMISHCGNIVIIFNGEIYNYRELREELLLKGYSFNSDSDTEVLLNLYLHCGDNLMQRLNGIFSFSIWDARSSSLLIARDAIGVKPLYYYNGPLGFAFSSELKSLIELVPSSKSLNYSCIQSYLTFLYSPGESLPLQDFSKLLPGHAISIKGGCITRSWCWYQLPVFSDPRPFTSLDHCLTGVVDHLRSAVHKQLVSDVPVGAFLSGGLDSSSIVAFAREVVPDINCFTIDVRGVGKEGFSNDLPFARRVSNYLDVPLHVVQVDSSQLSSGIERMVWQLDEPLADPAPLNALLISTLAREQGVKVLLSGAGGDDLFTGYRRHLALNSEVYWKWLPRSARILLRDLTTHLPSCYPFSRRLAKAFSGAHLNGDSRLVNYFRWTNRSDLNSLFSEEFRDRLRNQDADVPMLDYLSDLPSNTPPIERMLALEQRFFLVDHNLTYTDKMSMAAGVEVRVPFLDLDLVDFASRIPPRFKQRGRTGKWILKKAMDTYLPDDVIYRSKSGFGAPLRSWLRFELRDWLFDILSFSNIQNRGLFDPYAVNRLIHSNLEGSVDATYTLFSLACIEIWCKFFIDGQPAPSLRS